MSAYEREVDVGLGPPLGRVLTVGRWAPRTWWWLTARSPGMATAGSTPAWPCSATAGEDGCRAQRSEDGHFLETHVVVDRANLTLTLYRGGQEVFRPPVGAGEPGTPTAVGQFDSRERQSALANPECGLLAFGTSARPEHETDWPAGGFIGLHGTDQLQLISARVSTRASAYGTARSSSLAS
jgi:hypothetical protein